MRERVPFVPTNVVREPYRVPPPDWQGRPEAPDSTALSQAMADLGPPPAGWPDPDAVPFGTYWLVRFETCRQEVSRRTGRWARREEPMTSRAAAIEYARQLESVPEDCRSITVHEVRLQYQQIYPLGSPSTFAQLATKLRGRLGEPVASAVPGSTEAVRQAAERFRSTALPLPDLRVRAEVTRSRGGVVLRSCPHPKTRAVGGITSWPVYCQGETPQCGELVWDPEAQVWWPREQLAAYEAALLRGSA